MAKFVDTFYRLFYISSSLISTEAIRYLDLHSDLSDEKGEQLIKSFLDLLGSLLINAALAAHKLGGVDNEHMTVELSSRALNDLELQPAEKGSRFSHYTSASCGY